MKYCLYEIHLVNGKSAKWGISTFDEYASKNNLTHRIKCVTPAQSKVNETQSRVYVFTEPKFNKILEKNIHLKFSAHQDLTVLAEDGYTEWFDEIATFDIRAFADAWIELNDVLCEIVPLSKFKKDIKIVANPFEDSEVDTAEMNFNDVQTILAHTRNSGLHKERNYLILVLQFYCGLRRSEVIDLKISDVISKDRLIHNSLTIANRKIQLSHNVVRDAIHDYISILRRIDIDSPLIKSQKGSKFATNAMSQLITKLIRNAMPGINASARVCRVTFIRQLFYVGVNPRTIQKIVGHKNLATTMRYVRKDTSINDQAVMRTLYTSEES